MSTSTSFEISDHPDVMVSSTYTDLIEHRQTVIEALLRLGLFPRVMEFDSAKARKPVVYSSFELLAPARAYIGIIGHRYGSVPADIEHNPERLSVTELEYREALRLGIPVYMFLMSQDHAVKSTGVESSPTLRRKLERLRRDAQKRSICAEFSSPEELKSLVIQSMVEFKETLAKQLPESKAKNDIVKSDDTPGFPSPPQRVAIPEFVSGHDFVGRRAEFDVLSAWARSGEPAILIDAIGGAGKSTLAWEWIRQRASAVLPDVTGVFWYSFYQVGASLDTFCVNALAYITQRPIAHYSKMQPSSLSFCLLKELRERKLLIALDGLERVLIAYQRFDAAQLRDDEVLTATSERACIKPRDEYLLRQLIANHSSKVIITSRLLPAVFTDKLNQTIIGVDHLQLVGLEPDDALYMMQNAGINGNSDSIKRFLADNCENLPLMVGIVAGLVKEYVQAPCDFDRWVKDAESGAAFQLSTRSLSDRRTHLLSAAFKGLQPNVRRLLSRIAALDGPVRFETVEALNPFVRFVDADFDRQVDNVGEETEMVQPLLELVGALQELELRGLLHWDRKENTYDLHPVVRGYAFDILEENERAEICNEIVDHFQRKPQDRYEDAKTVADLRQSISIFRALVQARRFDEAAKFMMGSFNEALILSIEAYHEVLALLKPFFPNGYRKPPVKMSRYHNGGYLLNSAAIALRKTNRFSLAREAYTVNLTGNLRGRDKHEIHSLLVNLALCCFDEGRIYSSFRALELAAELARYIGDNETLGVTTLHQVAHYRRTGRFEDATKAYAKFQSIRTRRRQNIYRVGDGEAEGCWLKFYQGELTKDELEAAKSLAEFGGRETRRSLFRLEGELALELGDPNVAIAAFENAIEMTQFVGIAADDLIGRLALANAFKGDGKRAIDLCEQLLVSAHPPDVELALTYLQTGNMQEAHHHAIRGYLWAWAEGPPYSRSRELSQCRYVLNSLGKREPIVQDVNQSTRSVLECENHVSQFTVWFAENRPPQGALF